MEADINFLGGMMILLMFTLFLAIIFVIILSAKLTNLRDSFDSHRLSVHKHIHCEHCKAKTTHRDAISSVLYPGKLICWKCKKNEEEIIKQLKKESKENTGEMTAKIRREHPIL